jgi:hypothetical protein
MHHVNTSIPLFVLFRALGLESDEDIMAMIAGGSPDGHFVYKELDGCGALTVDSWGHIGMPLFLAPRHRPHGCPRELTTLFVAGPAPHVSGRNCCPTREVVRTTPSPVLPTAPPFVVTAPALTALPSPSSRRTIGKLVM